MAMKIYQALVLIKETDITSLFILGLLALAITLWELLRSGHKILKIGWKGWVNILMMTGAKNRRPADVSHLLIPPPPIARRNIEALKVLGFRRLGEAQIKSPFHPPVNVWVFANVKNHIQAEVAGKRLAFSTYFQEKALVVTDFPSGEHIETPNYQSHTIVTSVVDAYRYHLQQIVKFIQKYGQPHPIRTMTDYLHWEMVGRKNYGTRKLSRWVTANIVQLIAFFYGSLALILTPIFFKPSYFSFVPKFDAFSSQEILIYLMILLASPAIFLSRYFNRWMVRQTRKDSRSPRQQ